MTESDPNPSQVRFDDDRRREQVLAAFLDEELYPRIADSIERQTDLQEQKAGNDAEVNFEWLDRPVIVDEKAQSGDKYLNDPAPTFVMEIFGESSISDGEIATSTGWFIDADNKTEYYLLAWLPTVSLFELSPGVDENPYMAYYPGDSSTIIDEKVSSRLSEFMLNPESGEYRMEFTPANIRQFQNVAEPIPNILLDEEQRDLNRFYYDPVHIHEVKAVVVEKSKVVQAFRDEGLDRERFAQLGRKAVRTDSTVSVPTSKARYIKRSHRQIPGTNREENPVNFVVKYDPYHELADETYHFKKGELSSGGRLFK